MNINNYLLAIVLITGSICPMTLAAQPHSEFDKAMTPFIVEEIASGLGVTWGMSFLDSDRILYTQRRGAVGILNIDTNTSVAVSGVPEVLSEGQGGLLDVAIQPGYLPGDWIYFTYSKEVAGQGVTVLARARLENNRLADWTDIVITNSASGTSRHFGSRIAFDDSGHLFFTVGDRGHRPNGQDTTTHAGSVLRVNLDGSVPDNNPFVGKPGVLSEIWSYGHRNPQGIAFDRKTKRLWINEHGPRGGDEINLILPGRNYGWPLVSHGKEYWGPLAVGEAKYKPGIEAARKVYIPSIAPSSLLLYTGEAFAHWRGSLLSGALTLTHLNRVTLDSQGDVVSEERLLESMNMRIRQVIQSPEGWLYLATDDGMILRLRPRE